MSRKTASTGWLWVAIAGLLAFGSFSQHEVRLGLSLLAIMFALLLFWCAFQVPAQCRVVTTTGRACRRGTRGVLFGCRDHYWQKLTLRLRRSPPRPAIGAASAAAVGVTRKVDRPESEPGIAIKSSRREAVDFYCTIVSTVGTVVSTVLAFKT